MSYTRMNWMRFMALLTCGSALMACGESEPASLGPRALVFCNNADVRSALVFSRWFLHGGRFGDSQQARRLRGRGLPWRRRSDVQHQPRHGICRGKFGAARDPGRYQWESPSGPVLPRLQRSAHQGHRRLGRRTANAARGYAWSNAEIDCFRSYLNEIGN